MHGCMEIPDLFLVLNMIFLIDIMFNTRNKSGLSAHPCIILHIIPKMCPFADNELL